MTRPEIPTRVEKEGPSSPCTINRVDLKWKNCTCISCAAGMNKSSHGRVNMTGCAVRDEMDDTAGGTNLGQCQRVAAAHGIETELHTGRNVVTMWYASYQSALGRGFQLDGNEIVTKGKNVNHDVWVNNPVGGTPGDPDGFMVYDPDSNGPEFWSYSKTKAFALALHPYGEGDSRTLKNMGINGVYCLIYPDTEPHVHLRAGAVKSSPFPDRCRIDRTGGQWAYKSPAYGTANRARRYDNDDLFVGYQYATVKGRKWVGGHSGTLWVPATNLRHVGGTT